MSMADLKAFVKKCAGEKAIGEKAKKIGVDNIEGLIKYAGELGFTITQKDLENLKESAKGRGELTDDQLATISGGATDQELIRPMTEEERKALEWALNPSNW